MPTRTAQLSRNLGASQAGLPASEVFYAVVDAGDVVRIPRTNAGVRARGDGFFWAVREDVDVAWEPCVQSWDNGGAAGAPTRRASSYVPAAVAGGGGGGDTLNFDDAEVHLG